MKKVINIVVVSDGKTEARKSKGHWVDILLDVETDTLFLDTETFLETGNMPNIDLLILRGKFLDNTKYLPDTTKHLLRYYIGKKVVAYSIGKNYAGADRLGILHPMGDGIMDPRDTSFWDKVLSDIYDFSRYSVLNWEHLAEIEKVFERKGKYLS